LGKSLYIWISNTLTKEERGKKSQSLLLVFAYGREKKRDDRALHEGRGEERKERMTIGPRTGVVFAYGGKKRRKKNGLVRK